MNNLAKVTTLQSKFVGESAKLHKLVFNGISISKDDGVIYVTGKKWDRMFKVILNDF